MSLGEVTFARPPPRYQSALDWLSEHGVYIALLALLLFNLVFTKRFLEIDNIRLQFVQVVPVAIIALGMAVVIGTKGIDLSVGSVMAISSALLALYLGYGPIVAVLIALLGGAAVGLINGILIARFQIQPIVATLALLVGGRGLALVIAQGRLTEVFDPTLATIGSARLFGVPIVVLIALAVALFVAVLMSRTTFGRFVVAIGGNPEASSLAGVPVRRTLIQAYLLCACAGRARRGDPDRPTERGRPVIRRQSDRAERDHRRRRRWDPAVGRTRPDRRDAGRGHADATDRRNAHHP